MVTLIGILLITSLSIAGPNMQPGQWEITTTIEMPGMPMKMPPMTTTQCLTKDNLVPKQPSRPGVNQPCEITNSGVNGDTVSWNMRCADEGKTEGHGEITYHGDTFEGVIKMISGISGKGRMQMTLHMKGKRIGECK